MCVFSKPKMPAPQKIAAYDSTESLAAADMEARLRRRRSGAAAHILTSPTGLGGTTSTMGGVAA
ncbi:hypothetical protein SAMN04244548_02996 [Paracoccus pantotrophus]|nr:hypothetical protein SAMN04244548_02996 [Paracoccus pantotrophus]